MFDKLKPAWSKPITYMKIYSNGALIGQIDVPLGTKSVQFPTVTQSHTIDHVILISGDDTEPLVIHGPSHVPMGCDLTVNIYKTRLLG